eukprot:1160517-Pelagomonas_calceolata.AAC.11
MLLRAGGTPSRCLAAWRAMWPVSASPLSKGACPVYTAPCCLLPMDICCSCAWTQASLLGSTTAGASGAGSPHALPLYAPEQLVLLLLLLPACRTLIQQIWESSCAFFKQNPAQKHAQLVIGGSVKQAISFTRETTVEDHNLLIPERQALELVLSEVWSYTAGWNRGHAVASNREKGGKEVLIDKDVPFLTRTAVLELLQPVCPPSLSEEFLGAASTVASLSCVCVLPCCLGRSPRYASRVSTSTATRASCVPGCTTPSWRP